MEYDLFRKNFLKAAQVLREQTASGQLPLSDVSAMHCTIMAGLPSTPREHLPVWVLLIATLSPQAIDYEEMISMSYRLTFPWWKRLWWRVAEVHRQMADYDETEVKLRSYD